MLLEIKDSPDTAGTDLLDNYRAVLVQGVDHMHVLRSTDASLKHCVVLCVTGRSAWMLWFERLIENFDVAGALFETVSIHRIAHRDVWPLWFASHERTRVHPHWYLTRDAGYLRSTLSTITSANFCGTKILAKSQHRVYGVSLPQIVRYRSSGKLNKSVVGITLMNHDLCVKVIHGEREFEREATAAMVVAVAYN